MFRGLFILVIVVVVPVFFVLMWIVGAYNRLVACATASKTPTRKLTSSSSGATT